MTAPSQTTVLPDIAPDPRYKVGTLQYTKAGLFVLFTWLLWGDFCFQMFESAGGPGILGLFLQNEHHVSNFNINLIFGTIPQTIAIAVGPPLSFKSDRYRSRWGRRIPFMLFTAPFLCICAAALGYCREIINFMNGHLSEASFIAPMTASLLVIGLLVAGFTFFNEFVQNVYWYLFADVVPEAFMGRFIGMFRMVASLATFLLNIYIVPHQLTHMKWIHIGMAALYFFGFGAMCLGVKEGQYPPPTDVSDKTTFAEKCRLYAKECFTHRIFILTYVVTVFTAISGMMGVAQVFSLHVGQHKATASAHTPGRTVLAMSGDGKLAASGGSDGRVKIWSYGADAVGKQGFIPLKTLGAHAKPVTCMALSGDGMRAVSGAEDGQVKIWDVATGSCEKTLDAGSPIGSVALLRDGTTLLAGSADGRVRVWDLAAGDQPPKVLVGHAAAINCIAASGDERTIATGSSDKTIRLWNTSDWSAAGAAIDAPGPVYAVCFAPALEAVPGEAAVNATFIGRKINYFRDVFSNESLYDMPADQRTRITAADRWLVWGGRDGQTDDQASSLHVWDAKDRKELRALKGHSKAITAVQFKPDLRLIITGSRDTSMRLWDPLAGGGLASDDSMRSISGYTSGVTAACGSTQGPVVVNASDAGELHRWDVDQGVSLGRVGAKGSFFSVLAIILALPTGMLVDKFHPLRVTLFATMLIGPVQIAHYFFYHDYMSWMWLDCVKIPLYILLSAAAMPLSMHLYPKSKYGQFCAAASTIRSFVVIGVGMVGSSLMDLITRKSLLTDNFRYGYFWLGGSYILIFLSWCLVYREWKRLGGKKYVAPES